MRKMTRLSSCISALWTAISLCTSSAQEVTSTMEVNSSSIPSTMVLTMRPPCSAILASISSIICARNADSVLT